MTLIKVILFISIVFSPVLVKMWRNQKWAEVRHWSEDMRGPYIVLGGQIRRLRFPFRKHHYRVFLATGRTKHQWDILGKTNDDWKKGEQE